MTRAASPTRTAIKPRFKALTKDSNKTTNEDETKTKIEVEEVRIRLRRNLKKVEIAAEVEQPSHSINPKKIRETSLIKAQLQLNISR